jgi:hypothetical protein
VPNGVTTPLKPVEIDGKARLLSSVCEPHNCGHRYSILYDPAARSMTGVYGQRWQGRRAHRVFRRPEHCGSRPADQELMGAPCAFPACGTSWTWR